MQLELTGTIAPAQHVVKYKEVVFASAFKDETIYQGEPSAKIDEAWEDLYSQSPSLPPYSSSHVLTDTLFADFGISKINREDAMKLPNRTSALPGDEEHYIVELDVFHQLHCLNRIRKALSPDYYNLTSLDDQSEEAEAEKMHIRTIPHRSSYPYSFSISLANQKQIGHCIEHIRQGMVCNADISTVYWTWSPTRKATLADARITHTCRDFDAIKEWALENRLEKEWNNGVYVEGNPVHE